MTFLINYNYLYMKSHHRNTSSAVKTSQALSDTNVPPEGLSQCGDSIKTFAGSKGLRREPDT